MDKRALHRLRTLRGVVVKPPGCLRSKAVQPNRDKPLLAAKRDSASLRPELDQPLDPREAGAVYHDAFMAPVMLA